MNSHWDEDPLYPVADWKLAVENDETRQSYAEWAASCGADQTDEQFDDSLDDATHAVLTAFEWIGLPTGDEQDDLVRNLKNEIRGLMNEYL